MNALVGLVKSPRLFVWNWLQLVVAVALVGLSGCVAVVQRSIHARVGTQHGRRYVDALRGTARSPRLLLPGRRLAPTWPRLPCLGEYYLFTCHSIRLALGVKAPSGVLRVCVWAGTHSVLLHRIVAVPSELRLVERHRAISNTLVHEASLALWLTVGAKHYSAGVLEATDFGASDCL